MFVFVIARCTVVRKYKVLFILLHVFSCLVVRFVQRCDSQNFINISATTGLVCYLFFLE